MNHFHYILGFDDEEVGRFLEVDFDFEHGPHLHYGAARRRIADALTAWLISLPEVTRVAVLHHHDDYFSMHNVGYLLDSTSSLPSLRPFLAAQGIHNVGIAYRNIRSAMLEDWMAEETIVVASDIDDALEAQVAVLP